MRLRVLTGIVLVLIGVVGGSLLTSLLAQRAAYFQTAEQLALISSDLERSAKALAAEGKTKLAERQLVAAIGLRNALSTIDESELTPPLGAPWAMLLELLFNPVEPSLNIKKIYSDRATSFMYECALIDMSFPPDQEEVRVRERDNVVARYPNSNAANCAVLARSFLSK